MALGIGASTASFSVVYGVLQRPLPCRDAGTLVLVSRERDYVGTARPAAVSFSLPDIDEWRRQVRRFDVFALLADNLYALSDDGSRETVHGCHRI